MVETTEEFVYFKKNVPYGVGGRFHARDSIGFLLTQENPYVQVKKAKIRDFKMANKKSIDGGLILEVPEPNIDEDTPNAVSDERAEELVKSYMLLKNELPRITSLPVLTKIFETAKELDRPKKTLALIESRIEELDDTGDDISPEDMQGVVQATRVQDITGETGDDY